MVSLLDKLKPAKLKIENASFRVGCEERPGFQAKICESFWELSAWFQALSACLKELRESIMGDFSSIFARCLIAADRENMAAVCLHRWES